jgi:hypothetical protein
MSGPTARSSAESRCRVARPLCISALAEIEEVSEIGGHLNAVAVTVKDFSTVRVIRIEPGDDEGASSVGTALLSVGGGGGTIPVGGFGRGSESTHSFHVRNNDWVEVVIDDWRYIL